MVLGVCNLHPRKRSLRAPIELVGSPDILVSEISGFAPKTFGPFVRPGGVRATLLPSISGPRGDSISPFRTFDLGYIWPCVQLSE